MKELIRSPLTDRWYLVNGYNKDGSARSKVDVTEVIEVVLADVQAAVAEERRQRAEVEEALRKQGRDYPDRGGWHVIDCRFGKRQGGLPPEDCLERCKQARAVLKDSHGDRKHD